MNTYTIGHHQEYRHSLIQKYNDLCENYNELKDKTNALFEANIKNDEYSDKLLYEVDTIVISEETQQFFSKYVNDKRKTIQIILKDSHYLNEDNVSKLFDLRKKIIARRTKNLTINNIGTSLNVLREFYNDVYIDLERNKSGFNDFSFRGKESTFRFEIYKDFKKIDGMDDLIIEMGTLKNGKN